MFSRRPGRPATAETVEHYEIHFSSVIARQTRLVCPDAPDPSLEVPTKAAADRRPEDCVAILRTDESLERLWSFDWFNISFKRRVALPVRS